MAEQQVQTRTWQDLEIPPAGTYDIDPAHTTVEVIARHMMVAKVRGRFEAFSGTIEVADQPEDSTFTVEIEADSINTAEKDRDAHLRSPDFLDVEEWPHIRVEGRDPQHVEGSRFRIHGELTIKDATRPVEIEFTLEGVGLDPWGNTRAMFSGEFAIDREDFGMTWNQALETGGMLVGKELKAEVDCQAVLRS